MRAAATLTIVSVRQPASAWSRNSAGFGASLWPNSTGGSLASTMNGSVRETSSAPAPQKPWMVDRLCVPSIQRLLDAELEASGLGLGLEHVERAVDLSGVDAVAEGGGGGGGCHGRQLTRPAATLGKRTVGRARRRAPPLPIGYRPLTGVRVRFPTMSSVDTVIIGAGQAGLALSRLLTDARHDHVVLERGRVGERWRSERWDSLALLTPNWANRLPYDDEPRGSGRVRVALRVRRDAAALLAVVRRSGS